MGPPKSRAESDGTAPMKRGPGNGMPAPATGDAAVRPGKALPFGPEPGIHLAGALEHGGSAASGTSTSSGTANARHRRLRIGDRPDLRRHRVHKRTRLAKPRPALYGYPLSLPLLRSQRDLEAPLRERLRRPQQCMLHAAGTTTPNARHRDRKDAGMIRRPIAASGKIMMPSESVAQIGHFFRVFPGLGISPWYNESCKQQNTRKETPPCPLPAP